jgi:hypothetical protein
MHPKRTQPPEIGHTKKTVENHPKSSIITLKASKKNLTKSLVFRHPKMTFYL